MKLVAYNIQSGGFSDYDSLASRPERLSTLQETLRRLDADLVGLVDTFRWVDIFDPDELRRSFGYDNVYYINLGDPAVDERIGLALLARGDIDIAYETVRLATRNCIKATVQRAQGPVVVYVVYLNHESDVVRAQQITSLIRDANEHHLRLPTIVMGDLNSPPAETLPWQLRLASWMADKPLLSQIKPKLLRQVRELDECQVVPLLRMYHFADAYPRRNRGGATLRVPVPGLGNLMRVSLTVDHMFGRNTKIRNFTVKRIGDSDHWPICGSI